MSEKHVPTPWKIHKPSVSDNNILDGSGNFVGATYRWEDASFIVRAVNSHEALLEAAFAVVDDPKIRHVAHREFMGKLDDLKKAIAQAEGKQ